jgi:alginate O-acetyltransferase complex protein AlgI
MLFNTLEFLIFFVIIASVYYTIPHKYRWILLLGASYFFYGYWEIKYLLIIIGSTIVDFFVGLKIHSAKSKKRKRQFLYISLLTNLSVLVIFKYYNFFIDNITIAIKAIGFNYDAPLLALLLPVGISFYTFQTLSYSIDIYNGKIKQPEKHLGVFALFVSFFPQLVAGPIERASHLLPQFHKKVAFNYDRIASGLSLILWGLFKKIVVADRLSLIVNEVYNSPYEYQGFVLFMATMFFAFQIYCDFSGYSDIAIGAARILGFDLMKNFDTPYFSKSLSEFWKRWHISLSTWFRDYVYIPIGGNRGVKWRWYYNLLITFLLSGLWHGSNWTFIIWGAIHGVVLILENQFSLNKGKSKTNLITFLRISVVFTIVCLAWVFFRANSLSDASYIISELFNFSHYSLNQIGAYMIPLSKHTVFPIDIGLSIIVIFLLVLFEFIFTIKLNFNQLKYRYKLLIYSFGILTLFIIGSYETNTFIYFQF